MEQAERHEARARAERDGARGLDEIVESVLDAAGAALARGGHGAAARLVQKGDLVIIVSYVSLTPEEAKNWKPTVVRVDAENKIR